MTNLRTLDPKVCYIPTTIVDQKPTYHTMNRIPCRLAQDLLLINLRTSGLLTLKVKSLQRKTFIAPSIQEKRELRILLRLIDKNR